MGFVVKSDRLIEMGLYETWVYFIAMFNATEALRVNRALEMELLNKKAANARDIASGTKEATESDKKTIPVGGFCEINEINVSIDFLYNLNYENFIQHAHSFFDYLSHIIYLVYLKDKKQIADFDFGKLIKNKEKLDNENISTLVCQIESSDLYEYICDYNNMTKHNHGIDTIININFNTFEMVGMAVPFSKGIKGVEREHDFALIRDKMKEMHQFVLDSQQTFLNEFDRIYNQKGNEE